MPPITRERFEELVAEALDELPSWVLETMDNVEVMVEDLPPRGQGSLLGVYHGVPRPHRGASGKDDPDTIIIFKRSHEVTCRDARRLEEEVVRTVVHEIAHHFGIEHDDMGDFL